VRGMEKIKLAIIDDELISRNMIKKLIQNNTRYEVAADFSDGKSAVDWLRYNEIDILLCDMQMPEMNGVDLLRIIHVIHEYLPVIVISGFDNFDYVRGSLVNGAANYLLKHELTEESLLQVLEQVREKYHIVPAEKAACRRTGYCIYDREEYTRDGIERMIREQKIQFGGGNYASLAISPDYRFSERINPEEFRRDVCSTIMDILAQILGTEYPFIICQTKKFHLLVLLCFQEVNSTLYMMNIMKKLATRLQKQIIRILDLTSTIAIGIVHTQLEKALSESEEMDDILEDKLYLGGNRLISLPLARKMVYGTGEIPSALWKQMAFEKREQGAAEMPTLNEFFDFMEKERLPQKKVLEYSLEMMRLLCPGEMAECKKLTERVKGYEIFELLREDIMEFMNRERILEEKKKYRYSPLINQVMEFVGKNYQEDISLEMCALELGVSYTHVSRAFKQETGMRFVEYLNRRRISRAKSLLIRGELSMKEVVENSGFRNYNYFFKVFKEITGMKPGEFAAKI
jgi:two-component system response regulator YesN